MGTGTTVAHETAHNLGIGHDWEFKQKRKLGKCANDCKKDAKGKTCTDMKGRRIMGGDGKL